MPAGAARTVPPAAGATPAMAQWFAAKAEHPDALLFFRMGDFYELFFADAEAAAAALDIALSHRGEHSGQPIPMCGVPCTLAAEIYLARLIRRGFRVAVVEQMEDPKNRTGKAPIRRAVVRPDHTRHVLTEEALLEAGRPNLLVALARDAGRRGRCLDRRFHWPVRDQRDRSHGAGLAAGPAGTGRDTGTGRARPGRLGGHSVARTGRIADADCAPPLLQTFGSPTSTRWLISESRGRGRGNGARLVLNSAEDDALPAHRPSGRRTIRVPADGCGDTRQPGVPLLARQRRLAYAARRCAADLTAAGAPVLTTGWQRR